MKITDLRLDGFSNLAKRENGEVELYYLIDMNTLRVRYVEATGNVVSLEVNGRAVALDKPEIIDRLNMVLDESRRAKTARATTIKISDLHLNGFNPLVKQEGDEKELFYMIGMNTVRVRYVETTGDVISVEVNRDEIDLGNKEIISRLNANLDEARASLNKRQEVASSLKLGDLHLDGFQGMSKVGLDGGPSELYYMIGMNSLGVVYNADTEMVISIKVNGDEIDINNPQVIEELNDALDDARKKFGGPTY